MAIPRILDIHVLVLQRACHLQMARNLGAVESGIIEVFGNEWLFVEIDVRSLYDLDAPFSVKALREIGVLTALRIMRETLVVGMGRRAVDLEHSRVGQPCLGCVLNTIAVCHVFCFFHYFVVNDEEAKLPLPVMINVFTEKQIVFTATVPSVFQALPLNMFKSVTDRLCIMGTVATRRQKL